MKIDMRDPLTRAAADALARMSPAERDDLLTRVRAAQQAIIEKHIKSLRRSETGGPSR